MQVERYTIQNPDTTCNQIQVFSPSNLVIGEAGKIILIFPAMGVYASYYHRLALAIVEQVRQALEDRLKEVDWMKSEETRANALKKMSKFGVKIGYPDKWLDYTPLEIKDSDDFLSMVFKAREFESKEEIKEINAPTDKLKWFMTPQTVNAYYHPSLNEIVFPGEFGSCATVKIPSH